MKMVKVEWEDITSTQTDLSLKNAKKFPPVKRDNLGWLLEDNSEYTIILWGGIYDPNCPQSDATKRFDKGVIIRIVELNEGKDIYKK